MAVNKMALKWIRIEIANSRVKPMFNNENKLEGFYLRRLRGTVAKKWFMDDAWKYACEHFNIASA
jgi:hypothetical protein